LKVGYVANWLGAVDDVWLCGDNRLSTVTKGADTFTYVSDPGGNVTSRTYGRFGQVDPMPGGTAHEGAYVYAGQNPAMFIDPSGLRRSQAPVCRAPGVATTFKLFGKAFIDALPGVSSSFSDCQKRQGGAVAFVYNKEVVPKAKVVAVVSLSFVSGGAAAAAFTEAGASAALTECAAGIASTLPDGAIYRRSNAAQATNTAIGCVTGGVLGRLGSAGNATNTPGASGPVVGESFQFPGAGRSGGGVKNFEGPPNAVVKGASPGRNFVTDGEGRVILDITADRVKPVVPGQGFVAADGRKLAPTAEQLDWIKKLWGLNERYR
jgi:hypothetical protein